MPFCRSKWNSSSPGPYKCDITVFFLCLHLIHVTDEQQVCNCDLAHFYANLTVVSRGTALSWCLDNSFELIELNPVVEEDDEDGMSKSLPFTV